MGVKISLDLLLKTTLAATATIYCYMDPPINSDKYLKIDVLMLFFKAKTFFYFQECTNLQRASVPFYGSKLQNTANLSIKSPNQVGYVNI